MISEGSCDIEDWGNDVENSALRHRNKLHLKIYYNEKKVILNCSNNTQYYCFYCNFYQINADFCEGLKSFLTVFI